jgi:hypothetical protein
MLNLSIKHQSTHKAILFSNSVESSIQLRYKLSLKLVATKKE